MHATCLKPVPHEPLPGVRLWRVDLDTYAEAVALDRRQLAARHALRQVLAEVLHRRPESLVIEPDAWGKPRLEGSGVQFSLSHSEGEALIGVSNDQAIGVDIEVVREVPDAEALARMHFTDAERRDWARAAPALRDRTFLTCWTRKEACVKALGVGLSAPPEGIEAGCTAEAGTVSVPLGAERCEVALASLRLAGESVAAVALAGPEAVRRARAFFRRS